MMDFVLIFSVFLICLGIYFWAHRLNKKIKKEAREHYAKELDKAQLKIKLLEEKSIDPNKIISRDAYENAVKEWSDKYNLLTDYFTQKEKELKEEKIKNEKLVSQRQSNHVKLGQVVEKLYPLLPDFPYEASKCLPVYNPIDLIYFGDNDIVFIEIKSGGASLSSKQRKIKKLVSEGKIKFETHTVSSNKIQVR